jgi:hypothetical protein
MEQWKPIESGREEFYDQYPGYLSSHDAKQADDAELAKIRELIVNGLR